MSFVVKAKSEVINSFMALVSISVYIVKATKLMSTSSIDMLVC